MQHAGCCSLDTAMYWALHWATSLHKSSLLDPHHTASCLTRRWDFFQHFFTRSHEASLNEDTQHVFVIFADLYPRCRISRPQHLWTPSSMPNGRAAYTASGHSNCCYVLCLIFLMHFLESTRIFWLNWNPGMLRRGPRRAPGSQFISMHEILRYKAHTVSTRMHTYASDLTLRSTNSIFKQTWSTTRTDVLWSFSVLQSKV